MQQTVEYTNFFIFALQEFWVHASSVLVAHVSSAWLVSLSDNDIRCMCLQLRKSNSLQQMFPKVKISISVT